jgi:hypothetical protein
MKAWSSKGLFRKPMAPSLNACWRILSSDSRYEYEGYFVARAAQMSLKLYPVHDWHANVSNHAGNIVQLIRLKESRG